MKSPKDVVPLPPNTKWLRESMQMDGLQVSLLVWEKPPRKGLLSDVAMHFCLMAFPFRADHGVCLSALQALRATAGSRYASTFYAARAGW